MRSFFKQYGQSSKQFLILLLRSIEVSSKCSRLGGVVVSVLATGPMVRGFKPGRGDGLLRAIRIRSTLSYGWEEKPEVPCRKI
jgi:hypothetical protein